MKISIRTFIASACCALLFATPSAAKTAQNAADCAVLMAAELSMLERKSSIRSLSSDLTTAYSNYIEAFSSLAAEKGMSRQELSKYTQQRFSRYVQHAEYFESNPDNTSSLAYRRIMRKCDRMSKENKIAPIDF
ncbi:hypothetical protein [Tateyamaria sp.]|uniref:hypothetical protein n=1 Tax=Tateyamaria sp. TaxID=1929288 RepID=UPI00329D1A1E